LQIATLALAYAGLLDEDSHTSNGKAFIGKYVPNIVEIFRALFPKRQHDIESYEKLCSRGILDSPRITRSLN
jgi:hypothetical protein